MHILGISGSLRKNSLNTAALRACQALLPPGVSMEITDLIDVPIYNDDVREHGLPVSVKLLREKIAAAVGDQVVAVLQRHTVTRVGQDLIDYAFHFNQIFFGHRQLSRKYTTTGAKLKRAGQ